MTQTEIEIAENKIIDQTERAIAEAILDRISHVEFQLKIYPGHDYFEGMLNGLKDALAIIDGPQSED